MMFPQKEWAAARVGRTSTGAAIGAGIVRLTLLFGSVALAVMFFAAPVSKSPRFAADIDRMTTSSFIAGDTTQILHRDGLARSAGHICVFRENNTRSGNC